MINQHNVAGDVERGHTEEGEEVLKSRLVYTGVNSLLLDHEGAVHNRGRRFPLLAVRNKTQCLRLSQEGGQLSARTGT